MIDYLALNLTEYKTFRQLQLNFIKIKHENENLHSQLQSITQAYALKCKENLLHKKQETNEKLKLRNKNLKYKKLYQGLIENIEANLNYFKLFSKQSKAFNRQIQQYDSLLNQSSSSTDGRSIFINLEQTQNFDKICKKLSNMARDCIAIKQKNILLQKTLQKAECQLKSHTLEKQQYQTIISKQVQNLQNQLQLSHQTNLELEAKLSIKQKAITKLDLQIQQLNFEHSELQQRLALSIKSKQDQAQQDSEFALDFLTFQLQTIESFFKQIIESTNCSADLSSMMSIIYSDYQELSQIFRQKLQIEYDLEDLEQSYKSQNSSPSIEENLLIQTRRQIQTFRLELLKQKQVFRQKQQYIKDHFQEYIKLNETQRKVKHYSYELQNKLYKHKRPQVDAYEKFSTVNHTARDIFIKRNQLQKNYETQELAKQKNQQTIDRNEYEQISGRKTSIKFKQTNNVEEIMSQIIKKDKANLQKILAETRKSSIPIYLAR